MVEQRFTVKRGDNYHVCSGISTDNRLILEFCLVFGSFTHFYIRKFPFVFEILSIQTISQFLIMVGQKLVKVCQLKSWKLESYNYTNDILTQTNFSFSNACATRTRLKLTTTSFLSTQVSLLLWVVFYKLTALWYLNNFQTWTNYQINIIHFYYSNVLSANWMIIFWPSLVYKV